MSSTGKRDQNRYSHRKLIDRLGPVIEHGPLVGLLATTYEFQPEFFETDFLPTVLGLGAWDDRSWASRIGIERGLTHLEGATVFTDARHYQGRPRSLRAEVIPVIVSGGGALHAKVVLLVSRDAVRLHVSSANLTEPGYRRNREVAAPLLATRREAGQSALIRSALEGMRTALAPYWTETSERVVAVALEVMRDWPGSVEDDTFLWGTRHTAPFDALVGRWPEGDRVRKVTLVSPFWSEERAGEGVLEQLVHRLRAAGALAPGAAIRLLTEARSTGDGKYLPVLPATFADLDLRSLDVQAMAEAVDPTVTTEEGGSPDLLVTRTLHAKVILLEGATTSLAYLGSANFTKTAWGLLGPDATQNIEAGVLLRRQGKARVDLATLIPGTTGVPVPLEGAAAGRLALPTGGEPEKPWPSFLQDVRLVPDANRPEQLVLQIRLDPAQVRGPWSISTIGDAPTPVLLETAVVGDKGQHQVSLPHAVLEQLLRDEELQVRWWVTGGECHVPVNVAPSARDNLPIVPGSGKPGEPLLLAYYQGRITFEELFPDPEDGGPHEGSSVDLGVTERTSGVDTTRIQSYQVRELVEALKGIRDDLKQVALGSPRMMRLGLQGPVSPVALSRVIVTEVETGRRSPTAAAFQLFEILCCLLEARTYPTDQRYGSAWRVEVGEATRAIEGILQHLRDTHPGAGGGVFNRYEKSLRDHYGRAVEER